MERNVSHTNMYMQGDLLHRPPLGWSHVPLSLREGRLRLCRKRKGYLLIHEVAFCYFFIVPLSYINSREEGIAVRRLTLLMLMLLTRSETQQQCWLNMEQKKLHMHLQG